MNLASGSLGRLQKPYFWKAFSFGSWFNHVLKRNILATATQAEQYKRDIVQRTTYQFRHHNVEHSNYLNRPLVDLWLLNRFWGRLTKGISQHETQDLENAREKLEQYTRIHTIMTYANDICETATLLMQREDTVNTIIPLNIYRGSRHNQIENLFPEIEALIFAYYDLLDQCKDFPAWHFKLESEVGNQIAFLATSIDESSRDYCVANSEAFKRFDADKQKFFK